MKLQTLCDLLVIALVLDTLTLVNIKNSKSKEEKKDKKPKCKFKSIYIFSESNVGKGGEFLTIASELDNALVSRKNDFVYRGGF